MHTAPVSWRAEWNRPPAATMALVTARFPLPISPKTTSPPRAWTVRPTASETSIGGTLAWNAMRAVAPWIVLGALTAGAAVALGALGMPSPTLFAALVIGLTAALTRPRSALQLPANAFLAAQAVCGVTIGAYLQADALKALGSAWLPVLIVSAATLFMSIGMGWLLARFTELDRPTATLGMIAGGASGIVTMADDLGADDRLVAFMQYMRVLVVVLLTPLLTAVVGGGGGGGGGPSTPALAGATDWLAPRAIAPVGALAARRVGLPAGTLLGPM